MNLFEKIKFLFLKPKLIVVFEKEEDFISDIIFYLLKEDFQTKRILKNGGVFNSLLSNYHILIVKEKDPKLFDLQELKFLIKHSSFFIFVANYFDEKVLKGTTELMRKLSPFSYIIFNYDDEELRNFLILEEIKTISFGFGTNADLRVSDIKINKGLAFKLNYKGSVIPIWLDFPFKKEEISFFLPAFLVGEILDINFLKIAERLKGFVAFNRV
jgi:hypothetical protein